MIIGLQSLCEHIWREGCHDAAAIQRHRYVLREIADLTTTDPVVDYDERRFVLIYTGKRKREAEFEFSRMHGGSILRANGDVIGRDQRITTKSVTAVFNWLKHKRRFE